MAEFSLGTAALGTEVDLTGLKQGGDKAKEMADSQFKKAGDVLGGALKAGVVLGATAAVAAVATIGVAAFGVSNEIHTATQSIQADLGATQEEAERLGDVAVQVFKNNFAGSITDAGAAVAEVRKQLGDLNDAEMQDATENAFRLRDAYGVEIPESLNAVSTLTKRFGLTQQQAFDFIAKGYQKGLNASDDFLDTIGEYSNQFADAGFDAEQFFSILESGQGSGVLGTDKIADAIKEMSIILNEGTDDAKAAFESIGLNYDQVAASVASGDETWADYFQNIVDGINNLDDPIARSQAQVAIFGTMAEDLGVSFTEGLTDSAVALEDFGGAVDAVDAKYNNLGSAVEGYKRRALVALAPIGDELLKLANDAMPYVDAAFTWFENNLPGIFEQARTIVGNAVEFIRGLFAGPLGQGLQEGVGHFAYVKDWIDQNMPLIQQTVETVVGAITGFWDQNGEKITTIVRNFMTIARTLFDTYLKNILDLFKVVMQLINGDLEGAGETLKGIVRRTMEAMVTVVRLMLNNVKTAFGDIDWGQLGRNIIQGVIAGVRGAAHLLASAAQGAVEGALNSAKSWLGINSPSKRAADELGGPLGDGIGMGLLNSLERMAPDLRLGVDSLFNGLQTANAGNLAVTQNIYTNDSVQAGNAATNRLQDLRRRRG